MSANQSGGPSTSKMPKAEPPEIIWEPPTVAVRPNVQAVGSKPSASNFAAAHRPSPQTQQQRAIARSVSQVAHRSPAPRVPALNPRDVHNALSRGRCVCGICGASFGSVTLRSEHERETHNYERFPRERDMPGVVRLTTASGTNRGNHPVDCLQDQLKGLKNFDKTLADIQQMAVDSERPTSQADATDTDIRVAIRRHLEATAFPKRVYTCHECGLKVPSERAHREHIALHLTTGFCCSCCGLRFPDPIKRNAHEARLHFFERLAGDRLLKTAVRLNAQQLLEANVFAKNFEQVQAKAIDPCDVRWKTAAGQPTDGGGLIEELGKSPTVLIEIHYAANGEQADESEQPSMAEEGDENGHETLDETFQSLDNSKGDGSMEVGPFECGICGFVTNHPRIHRDHQNGHERNTGFRCSFCGVLFQTSTQRNRHEQMLHAFERLGGDKSYKGAIKIAPGDAKNYTKIGTNFAEVQAEANNASEDSAKPWFTCTTCGFVAKSLQHHVYHTKGHERKRGFCCSFCGVFFEESGYRNRHEQKYHGFERQEADKSSNDAIRILPDEVDRYLQVGTNFAQVQADAKDAGVFVAKTSTYYPQKNCDECGIRMFFPLQHRQLHENKEKKFICSVCGIGITRMRERRVHEFEVHNFGRDMADWKTQEAVVISEDAYGHLRCLTINFAAVQSTAVASKRNDLSRRRTAFYYRQVEENRAKKTEDRSSGGPLFIDERMEYAISEEEMRRIIEADDRELPHKRPLFESDVEDEEDDEPMHEDVHELPAVVKIE